MVRQCELLGLTRSVVYYTPQETAKHAEDEQLMRLIDALHLRFPFKGSRRLRDALWDEHSFWVNRKRVQRLMVLLDIQALHPRQKTTRPAKGHRVYPYLLRGLEINRIDQVWCADITYIPMRKGFMYLVAIMDWHSRRVLSWRLSNTLDADFCVEALKEALERYGQPIIFNTDQGCQFTSEAFTDELKERHILISMDGKGRWMDNVFIERLWRSLKYEEVYLKAYDSVAAAEAGISWWMNFYNQQRRHAALDRKTPDQVYYGLPSQLPKAA